MFKVDLLVVRYTIAKGHWCLLICLRVKANPIGIPGTIHHVDGLAGATITARGVNDMLMNYLQHYENYLKEDFHLSHNKYGN